MVLPRSLQRLLVLSLVVASVSGAAIAAGLYVDRGLLPADAAGGVLLLLGWLGVFALGDRTERDRQEEKAHYAAVFESSPDGQCVVFEGRFEQVNAAACAMLGRSREEIIGRTPVDLSPETQPGGQTSAAAAHDRLEAARSGRPQCFEWRHLRADGSPLDAEVTLKVVELDGEPRLLATLRDITERKRVERETERLATAIGQTTEGIVVTDVEGNIEYVNEAFCQITGYGREEVLGKNPSMLKSGHQDEAFYREMWSTIQDGRVWEGHLVNRRKDGTFYEEEMTITPIHGADGSIQSYVAVKRDVTERVLLESQLQQAQKMEAVGQLAGGVAHDFNNMLTGITGYAQLLMRSIREGDDRADLEQILELATRAADLTQQLLAFSRRQQLEQVAVDMNALVGSTLKMLRRLIPEDINVVFQGAPSIRPVLADSGQIVQVLMNLAVNARDAMPDGGELLIETENVELTEAYTTAYFDVAPGNYVVLSVSDSGIGIDKRTQKHIFEPFFTTKGTGEGTGLGLATVFGIVKQHGGHIGVYSEPGVGTTFKIYLPTTDLATATVTALHDAPAELPEIATVLLVEDEEAVREIIERTLGSIGCHILSAGKSSEARQLYDGAEQGIDLLVTDVVMPGGLGTDLYAELAAIDPDLKVLFMSGYPDRGAALLANLPEGGMFLRKPFSPSTLAEHVRLLLSPGNPRA